MEKRFNSVYFQVHLIFFSINEALINNVLFKKLSIISAWGSSKFINIVLQHKKLSRLLTNLSPTKITQKWVTMVIKIILIYKTQFKREKKKTANLHVIKVERAIKDKWGDVGKPLYLGKHPSDWSLVPMKKLERCLLNYKNQGDQN